MEIDKKTKYEIVFEENVKKFHEYFLKGKIRHKKGLFLWSYNYTEDVLEVVTVEKKASIDLKGNPKYERKAEYQEDTIYFEALNEQSAVKKASKIMLKLYGIDDHKDFLINQLKHKRNGKK